MLDTPSTFKPLGISHIEPLSIVSQLLDGAEFVNAYILIKESLEELGVLYTVGVSACARAL
jgi:hypothetical protein